MVSGHNSVPVLALTLLLTASPAFATECSTVVLFGNGIYVEDPEWSARVLTAAVRSRLATLGRDLPRHCFGIAQATSRWNDIIEAVHQGLEANFRNVWRQLLGSIPIAGAFEDAISELVLRSPFPTTERDISNHVEAYDTLLSDVGTNVVVVAHSQGNFFVNEAYRRLVDRSIPIDQSRFDVVSVATPAPWTIKGAPHVTLFGDVILSVATLLANTDQTNTPCVPNPLNPSGLPGLVNAGDCHSFANSYLQGAASKPAIIERVIAAIPIAPPPCVAPTVTAMTSNQTITRGDTRRLQVWVSGSAPLHYQWYRGSTGDTMSPIGEMSFSLLVSPDTTTDYWVRVDNQCGLVDSVTTTVSVVTEPPQIETESVPTNEPCYSAPVIDSMGRMVCYDSDYDSRFRLVGFAPNGAVSWRFPPDGSYYRLQSEEAEPRLLSAPDGRVFFAARRTIFAFEPDGAPAAGWPVNVGEGFNTSGQILDFRLNGSGDALWVLIAGDRGTLDAYHSRVIKMSLAGERQWSTRWDGALQGPIVETPWNGLGVIGFSPAAQPHVMMLDADDGFLTCASDPVGLAATLSGGPSEGLFVSATDEWDSTGSYVAAVLADCRAVPLYSAPYLGLVEVYSANSGVLLGRESTWPNLSWVTDGANTYQVSSARPVGISVASGSLWKTASIEASLPGELFFQGAAEGQLIVLAHRTPAALNAPQLFVLDARSGVIARQLDVESVCGGLNCRVSRGGDGNWYISSFNGIRRFR